MQFSSTVSFERRLQPELMDQPGLDPHRHHQALNGLRRINWLSGSAGIVWPSIRQLARRLGSNRIRVLDVASGGGDVAIALWRLARRRGLHLTILGCDISPQAVEFAKTRSSVAGTDIKFCTHDVLRQELPETWDVVMSSLFLHHLTHLEAVDLLCRMARATQHLLLINDLRRSVPNYVLAQVVCRLLTRSPVVHNDGPSSVAASFTLAEVRSLCVQAQLAPVTIERRWPFRFLLTWDSSRVRVPH